jgi:hybrid cluster-associated redox disulfide protein
LVDKIEVSTRRKKSGGCKMLPKGANLQKIRDGKRTYAITPHLPGGFIKPEMMEKYAQVARKYGGILKLTSAQRIMITGLKAEDIENIWQDLDMQPALGYANCVRSVKICPGVTFCKRGKQDSVKLGLELDRRYIKKEMPSRMKMGVSGCANSCSEAIIKDIGVIGSDGGWVVYVGGSAGSHPRLGDKLMEGLDYENTLRLVDTVIHYYQKNADIERIGQFIDRIGLEKFTRDVLAAFHNHSQSIEAPVKPLTQTAHEAIIPKPGGLTEGTLVFGDQITANSVIADIIRVYPKTIPVFRSFGMGCLGCPSATGEALIKAADIHGLDLPNLLAELNKIVQEGKHE